MLLKVAVHTGKAWGFPWREWILPHSPRGTILRLLKTGVDIGGAEEEGPGKVDNSATQRAHAIR